MTRPNSVSTLYAYDNLSRPQSVLHQLSGSTIDGATYTVDNAGNRASRTPQPSGTASNYTYDAIYELTNVTQGTNTTETYTYDPVGNRLSSLGLSPYNVNTSNELTSTPSTTYTYDYNGNTATEVTSSGTTTFAWDFENRLASVTLPGTGGTVSFKYDPFGRRIYKSSSSGTSIYAYDGDNLVEEANSSGAAVARYSQTQNIDEPLAMLRAGATSYYHADGLGSVSSLSNAAGSIANTYTYDSFGKLTNSSGSLTNPFRYTGREFDTDTSLYYYRNRYYDANVGRFVSEDPIGFNGAINYYPYVGNNSTNLIDPKGLLKVCCRPANLGDALGVFAVIHLMRPPCHCFLQLGNGTPLGGYHEGFGSGNLVLQSDNINDRKDGPNHNRLDCETVPGKQCENDARAQNAFNSLPKKLGGYGFGDNDVGTSNDAARAILKDAGLGSTLPVCAWGKGGFNPTLPFKIILPLVFPGPKPKPI